MSDEVRSSSTPTPAVAGEPATESVDGPRLENGSAADTVATEVEELAPPETDAALADPNADASTQLLPQLSSELSPARHSERPPPPSQRKATVRVESVVATLRPGRDGILPPAATPATSAVSAPVASQSEPVPLVMPKVTTSSPVQRATSSMPPGLVEPKRIIQVLGSNVPVLDSALEEEEIEDLDESEAHEVSEAAEAERRKSEPELELNLVIDDSPPSSEQLDSSELEDVADSEEPPTQRRVSDEEAPQVAVPGDDGAVAPSLSEDDGTAPLAADSPLQPDAAAAGGAVADAPRRVKAPPNRRKRPPPPSSRSTERAKIEPPQVGRKWWEEMFSEEFLRAIPILSQRQLEREVNFIDDSLGVARGGRILDLACGAGQHAVELAARSYDLVGFDLSQSQLDWAGGLAQERGQRLSFTHGDMRDLAYAEAFDAIYSWNTSFGFFEEEKNIDIAQRIFRALRPGGRFLLDVVNRDYVVSQQPGQTWFEGDGCVCIDDVTIDFITSRMKVKRTLMLTSGKNRECNYSVRIYGLHELGKMLHDVGFKILTVSGRPEMPGVFFGSTSPRIIILASKP